jgi:hypothetical protein
MRVLVTLMLLASTTFTVEAACFEGIGCTDSNIFPRQQLRRMSCQNLWFTRNTIYAENGYCFKTERAQEVFGDRECWVHRESRLRLNRYERANIARVRQVEQVKGCG